MPIAALIHLAMALLAFISTGAFFLAYLRTKNEGVLRLSGPFFFITCYTLAMGVPVLVTHDPDTLAWSLFAGLVSIFLCILTAYRLPIFERSPVFGRAAPYLIATTIVVATIVLILEFLDPNLPTVTKEGLVIWNVAEVGAWLLGGLCLFTGLSWGFLFLENSRLVTDWRSRFKVYILALDGILFGIAGFIYFLSQRERETLTAYFLMVLALSCTAVVFTRARFHEEEGETPA